MKSKVGENCFLDEKTLDQIKKAAKINIDKEKTKIDLEQTLIWIKRMDEVNTDNIEPLINPLDEIVNYSYKYTEEEVFQKEDVFSNASNTEDDFFVVPKAVKR